jgi:phosphoglycerate dehydrogenase-like enzyme
MAPTAIADLEVHSVPTQAQKKPQVYLLDEYHPAAVSRAQTLFNAILPDDPEHKNWKSAEYLLVRSSRLTAEDVASCPNLRAVGKQGVGTDKIDSEACLKRGIKVLNTPGVNARAVAELVLALVISLAREIRPISLRLSAGETVPKEKCSGLIIHKRSLGVVGMGNIGKTVAKMFQGAFESPVIAYDPYMSADAWSDVPHTRVTSLDDLLQQADIVTIHVPLTPDTKNLIGYREMELMKRSAILINTARGGIVNEEDLPRALENELIWGVGLDCHEQEPPTKLRYEKLWNYPNVISLPHVGAATAQTQMETALAAVEKLYAYASNASV